MQNAFIACRATCGESGKSGESGWQKSQKGGVHREKNTQK
ncbi:hypothetical protein M5D96_005599, partial [Drosophila gunungcola]